MTTTMTQEELAERETPALISSDKVEGTPVFNGDGEHLGTVSKLMIDKRSGRVSYAVMSFGGVLGIGEEYHPLPWATLHYDTGLGGYVVNISRDTLAEAPRYAAGAEPAWEDPLWGDSVHDYYDVPPPRARA